MGLGDAAGDVQVHLTERRAHPLLALIDELAEQDAALPLVERRPGVLHAEANAAASGDAVRIVVSQ